jgi:hypothetical protein
MTTREELRRNFEVEEGDFRPYDEDEDDTTSTVGLLSSAILNGLMEDDPDRPHYKKTREGVEERLHKNLLTLLPGQIFVVESDQRQKYAYYGNERLIESLSEIKATHPTVLDGSVLNLGRRIPGPVFDITISNRYDAAGYHNGKTVLEVLSIYKYAKAPVSKELTKDEINNIVKAIKATSMGIDIQEMKKKRKEFAVGKLTERVGDIMAEKGAPPDPLMMQKVLGKFLAGKRRKTKKTKKSRRKTRRST